MTCATSSPIMIYMPIVFENKADIPSGPGVLCDPIKITPLS